MKLGNIIEQLKLYDPNTPVRLGFHEPHSYRGYYRELAFEPHKNTTVGAMLACCEYAKNRVFEGYKGGEYVYDDDTDCWLAFYGNSGETLGRYLLCLMVGDTKFDWLEE